MPGLGGSDDAADAAVPADSATPVVDGGGADSVLPCGAGFSVAYADLVHTSPEGGSLEGIALLIAEDDPISLAALEVDAVADPGFDVHLDISSEALVSPHTAHGGLEGTAASQIGLVIDPEQWVVTDQPVLTYVIGSAVSVPSIRDHGFALVIGAQRADLAVRVRYGQAYEKVTARRAIVIRSHCAE